MSRVDPSDELERLPGVVAATLFLDPHAPARIYLATTPDADPDTLRPAVVELLEAHGLHTRVDQVHIAPAPAPAPGAGAGRAIALDAVEVERRENRVECTVRLRSASRITSGVIAEPDTPSGRARAAARATLQAAEALDPDYRFGLEGLRILDLFGERALVLLIDATAGRDRGRLPGTALLDRSVEEAAALATLHALRAWPL